MIGQIIRQGIDHAPSAINLRLTVEQFISLRVILKDYMDMAKKFGIRNDVALNLKLMADESDRIIKELRKK